MFKVVFDVGIRNDLCFVTRTIDTYLGCLGYEGYDGFRVNVPGKGEYERRVLKNLVVVDGMYCIVDVCCECIHVKCLDDRVDRGSIGRIREDVVWLDDTVTSSLELFTEVLDDLIDSFRDGGRNQLIR